MSSQEQSPEITVMNDRYDRLLLLIDHMHGWNISGTDTVMDNSQSYLVPAHEVPELILARLVNDALIDESTPVSDTFDVIIGRSTAYYPTESNVADVSFRRYFTTAQALVTQAVTYDFIQVGSDDRARKNLKVFSDFSSDVLLTPDQMFSDLPKLVDDLSALYTQLTNDPEQTELDWLAKATDSRPEVAELVLSPEERKKLSHSMIGIEEVDVLAGLITRIRQHPEWRRPDEPNPDSLFPF